MVHKSINRFIKWWPWESTVTPIYAVIMIIQGIMMFVTPEDWDVATYEFLLATTPIYLWATVSITIGLAVFVLSRYGRFRIFEFLMSAFLLWEGIMITLAVILGGPVAPTASLRTLAIAIVIWLSLLRRATIESEIRVYTTRHRN